MDEVRAIILDEKESLIPSIELKPLKGKPYAELCLMGDFHLGSGNFSLGQYLNYVRFILDHPEIRVGLMGDLIEMGCLSNYGASEEKVGAIQLIDMVELLKPLKDRIILMLEGNHEERFWRATKGTDSISRSISDALRIQPMLPGPERGQLFVVEVNGKAYSVYAIHGYTGSTAQKATQLIKVFGNIQTSLAAHGHNHQIFKDHRTFYGVREINGKYYTTVQEQHWLTTGCFVKNLGYAERTSMPVTKIGAPFVRFYANKNAIEIIDDPRITYNIGETHVGLGDVSLEGLDIRKYEERVGFGGTEIIRKRKWKEEDLCPSKKLDIKKTA